MILAALTQIQTGQCVTLWPDEAAEFTAPGPTYIHHHVSSALAMAVKVSNPERLAREEAEVRQHLHFADDHLLLGQHPSGRYQMMLPLRSPLRHLVHDALLSPFKARQPRCITDDPAERLVIEWPDLRLSSHGTLRDLERELAVNHSSVGSTQSFTVETADWRYVTQFRVGLEDLSALRLEVSLDRIAAHLSAN